MRTQGESRRWATQGGLRTFSLLSTETDDFEALLEEFEPTRSGGTMDTGDLLDAEVALIGAKSKLDTTADALSKFEPKTMDAAPSSPHKGSVLTGFAWRRSGSSSAPRPASVAEEAAEKPALMPISATMQGRGYPAPFSSSGSTPTAFDLPEVPLGGTELPREGVFDQILAGLGGGSAVSGALSLPEYPRSVGISTDDEVHLGARQGSPGVISRISPEALAPFLKGGGPVSPTSTHSSREKPAFKPASILSSGRVSAVDVSSATLKPFIGAPPSAAPSAAPSAGAGLLDLPAESGLAAKGAVSTQTSSGDAGGNLTLPTVGVALGGAAAVAGALAADGEAEQEGAKEASGEALTGLEGKGSFVRMLSNRLGFGRNRVSPSQMSIHAVCHGHNPQKAVVRCVGMQ